MPIRRSTARTDLIDPFCPVVVPARPADLAFVVQLQKAYAAALGFLPRQALRQKIGRGQVLLARVAGKRAGFLYHGSLARPEVRVFQVAVIPSSRGKGVGRALVQRLLGRATTADARGVSLRCLWYLDANRFWRAAGFSLRTVEPGAKGTLNVWVWRSGRTASPLFDSSVDGVKFSSRVHPCPACGQPTTDTWVRGARRTSFCPECVAAAPRN